MLEISFAISTEAVGCRVWLLGLSLSPYSPAKKWEEKGSELRIVMNPPGDCWKCLEWGILGKGWTSCEVNIWRRGASESSVMFVALSSCTHRLAKPGTPATRHGLSPLDCKLCEHRTRSFNCKPGAWLFKGTSLKFYEWMNEQKGFIYVQESRITFVLESIFLSILM